jgi:hypothetical protein
MALLREVNLVLTLFILGIGIKKWRITDFKNPNLPLWQNAPKKQFKVKNYYSRSKFGQVPVYFLNFFHSNFCWSIIKLYLHFWNQHKIFNFLIPNITYSKKKKFHFSEGPFFKCLDTKLQIRKKPLKIKKNTSSRIVTKIFSEYKKA